MGFNDVCRRRRLIGASYAYFRPYREFVDVPGEHGAAGEYTGVRRGHYRRRDRTETLGLKQVREISSNVLFTARGGYAKVLLGPTNEGHPLGREIPQDHWQRGVSVVRGERSVVAWDQGPVGGASDHPDYGRRYREYQATEHRGD